MKCTKSKFMIKIWKFLVNSRTIDIHHMTRQVVFTISALHDTVGQGKAVEINSLNSLS